jgi:hypothetical protein
MGITARMKEQKPVKNAQNLTEKLYREERSYRADRLVEKWSAIPEIGEGIKELNENDSRGLCIALENQARYFSRLSEAQLSSNFQGLSPENMIRLVRLTYPNSIRGKIFTEFAMETAKDSIKYIRPVYTNTATGKTPNRNSEADWNLNGETGYNGNDYRKAMYESTEDRYPTELANGVVYAASASRAAEFGSGSVAASTTEVWFGGTTTEFALGYIDGYSILKDSNGDTIALQDKSGSWFVNPGVTLSIAKDVNSYGTRFTITTGNYADVAKAIGRYNSEGDLPGDWLGEVELIMTDYQFKPRPIGLGVTFTQLTELILDTSFGVSAEELLLDSAGQEIKKSLDYNAVKLAYAAARTNPTTYRITFDAEAGAGTDDSYLHTAQTFSQAVERIGDVMYNDIGRGGVSRIVGGPAGITYLRLNSGFTTKGAQPRIGGYQVGELYGIPVFKVPSSIIPDNTLLCVWKNDENEADVSLAFGTLVPFFSTGVIQRKNFYKEAALAQFSDYAILQKKYLGIITIDNIREIS